VDTCIQHSDVHTPTRRDTLTLTHAPLLIPGISAFTALKDSLVSEGNSRSDDILDLHSMVLSRWRELTTTADARSKALAASFGKHQEIESLMLEFAKKASEFNSECRPVTPSLPDVHLRTLSFISP
jgi:hypothetical protein